MHKFQIWLAEDNDSFVYLLNRGLQMSGVPAHVHVFTDGSAPLSTQAPPPDLLILDLNLSGTSGLDILETLRGQPHLQNTRAVVLTGSTLPPNQERLQALGVERYLIKPSDLNGLLKVCEVLKTILQDRNGA